MKQFRKFMVTIIGGFLLLIGMLMVILPGPAVVVIPFALLILNSQYPDKVRLYVRKFQHGLTKFASWLDNKLAS